MIGKHITGMCWCHNVTVSGIAGTAELPGIYEVQTSPPTGTTTIACVAVPGDNGIAYHDVPVTSVTAVN